MEYISSDTNVWLDFATINRLEIPFKLPYTYIMNEDAITDELLSPKELRDNLDKMISNREYIQDEKPCLYIYRQIMKSSI